ncbi:MAG: hypothetical protein OK449_10095 [Thaumarchaeota archaeon]|nr:hypothetical protein [Nitrososphaerota archaeon]
MHQASRQVPLLLVALALLPLLAVLPQVYADDPGTTTNISCSLGTLPVNAPTVCTVTVSDTGLGLPTPGGNVTMGSSKPGTFGGACTLTGSGLTATCSVSYTPSPGSEGNNMLSAFYTGDASYGLSAATFDVQAMTRETSTSVSCVAGALPVNGLSTCTATVTDTDIGTATTPTGTVSFSSSAAGTSSSSSCILVSGSCSVGYAPSAGSESVNIVTGGYGGDTDHAGSGATLTPPPPSA